MTTFTKLEKAVIDMLLEGNDEVLIVLRKQLDACKVRSRELTGVGFFTEFDVPDSMEVSLNVRSFKIGDVFAEIEGVEHGAGFILFVEDGTIAMLEGFTFDGPWPNEIGEFRLSYTGKTRDLGNVEGAKTSSDS